VYALVDKVALEPNSESPTRIKISGVFITARERSDEYSEPVRGYLYFKLPASNEALALREWNDLKTIAGTRQVVGIGSSWHMRLRVRKPGEQAEAPDEYSMGNGLVQLNAAHPRAKALLEFKDR